MLASKILDSGLVRVALVSLIVWPLIARGMPELEGYYFPVTINNKILKVEASGRFHTLAWGNAEKVRDCDFVDIEWFIGSGTRVDHTFEEGSKVRGAGNFDWGPWRVHVETPSIERTHAYVYHQCPIFRYNGGAVHRPWLTRTLFYDGRTKRQ